MTLNPSEARQLFTVFANYDAMLGAYFNEYGDELAKTLTGQVIEGEIVEQDEEETGQAGEGDGVDSQEETLLSETLLEGQDEDE